MSLNYGRVCPNIENPMAEVRVKVLVRQLESPKPTYVYQ